MSMFMKNRIRSLILTSGTLAPLKPLISALELDVKVQLENPHIIKRNQICVKILTTGPDGVVLNSRFKNRDNPEYISSLGRSILNLSRIIPNGLLVFFPSYYVMEKCQTHWQKEGLWTNITDIKAIYVEPKQKEAFNETMTEYYSRVQNPQYKGAIFLGVCRGKVSEGLDFIDINGRAVIIIGLPYASIRNIKIILKAQYLDRCNLQDSNIISGDRWYTLEASRAVNQAIGRVIRHQNDYGAILLLDSRFLYVEIQSQLSKWLRNHIEPVASFGEIIRTLRDFYRKAEANLPAPKLNLTDNINNTQLHQTSPKRVYCNFSTNLSGLSLNNPTQSTSSINNCDTCFKRTKLSIVYDEELNVSDET